MRSCASSVTELPTSRAAEARRAVSAERGRIAREMHDVLAHSLSALALQLETTRLLAHDRGVDTMSHARSTRHTPRRRRAAGRPPRDRRRTRRRAPGTGANRALADAFGEQSGLPVAVEVHGRTARARARCTARRLPDGPGGPDQRAPPRDRRARAVSWPTCRRAPCWSSKITAPPGTPPPAGSGARGRRLRSDRDARARRAAGRRAARQPPPASGSSSAADMMRLPA